MSRPRLTRPFTRTKGQRLGAATRDRLHAGANEDDAEQGLVVEAEKFQEELRKVRKQQKLNAKRGGAGEAPLGEPAVATATGGEEQGSELDEDEKEARAWALIQAEREDGKGGPRSKRLASKARILDGPAMEALAAELHLPDFAESLVIVADAGEAAAGGEAVLDQEEDPDDDGKREVAFVQSALRAVKLGRHLLDELKVPHYRPNDYMATMLKSDEHMARVKRRLLKEQKAMQVVEARRHAKKYKLRAKQVQQAKEKEKADRKKAAGELAAAYRSTQDARSDRVGGGEHEGADLARDKRNKPSYARTSERGRERERKRLKPSAAPRPGKSKRASFKSGKGGGRRG